MNAKVRALLGASAVAMLAVALLAPATMAAGNGNGNAHKHGTGKKAAMLTYCKKGHWRSFKREDDSRFRNQGRCVSYVAHGHTPLPLAPAITIDFAPVPLSDPATCQATAHVEDLVVRADLTALFVAGGVSQPDIAFTTDRQGDATLDLGAWDPLADPQPFNLNVAVGVVSSGDVTVGCVPV